MSLKKKWEEYRTKELLALNDGSRPSINIRMALEAAFYAGAEAALSFPVLDDAILQAEIDHFRRQK